MTFSELVDRIEKAWPNASYSVQVTAERKRQVMTEAGIFFDVFVWPPGRTLHVQSATAADAWAKLREPSRIPYKPQLRKIDPDVVLARREAQ